MRPEAVDMLDELDGAEARRWVDAGIAVLTAHRAELNGLNVFPVADADTGTNLLVTLRAAAEHAGPAGGREGQDAAGMLAALATGAVLGAHGNSGIVLGALLRGLADAAVTAAGPLGSAWLRDGLRRAAGLATAAFATPVDGTALTVLVGAADAADTAGSDKLAVVADAAVTGAAAALADTPRLLPVLARAGVVDAGGRGMLLLLEAMAAVVAGREPAPAPPPRVARAAEVLTALRDDVGAVGYDYEVMYLLDGSTEAKVSRLRAELAAVGDSVAIVGAGMGAGTGATPGAGAGSGRGAVVGDAGDGGTWKVHVHCTDVGAAIEAGIEAGRPHRITVIRFADRRTPGDTSRLTGRAVVAVVRGAGMTELFRGEGVTVAPADGVLDAITGTGAAHVVVLPNATTGTAAAERAADLARAAGHDVVVVPTASPVQGLAALAVHDPARRAGDDVVAMAEAAAATRCGELAVATEEALTWAGRCRPGDVLGVVDGEVVLIGADVTATACDLVRRMLSAGGELVTVLLGADAPAGLADALTRTLHREHPEVELVVYPGGQSTSPLLVGVE